VVARFYTLADSGFFVGAVALLNSLRLTGHDHELVVLDCGLKPEQRAALEEGGATLLDSVDRGRSAYFLKPYPATLDLDGVVVIIDSDMVVTASLDAILARAADGDVCVFPDHPTDLSRWFEEWHELFQLRAPLRHGTYMNAGFLAVSAERWASLLQRWRDLCERLPSQMSELGHPSALAQRDQDALNALLMSEVPPDVLHVLPSYELNLRRIKVVDSESLLCVANGEKQPILHLALSPKVWQPGGWRRVGMNMAYVRLLPRLLFGSDVPVRLEPEDVPFWLRPGRLPRLAVRVISPWARFRTVPARARRAPRRVAREAQNAVVNLRTKGQTSDAGSAGSGRRHR
jgi:hypothetical protein